MKTARETIAAINVCKLANILGAETGRWRARSDGSWAAAHARSIERRAYRVNVACADRTTPVRMWAWVDCEDSRWEGEGHAEAWHIGLTEPSQIVGGWGGGDCEDLGGAVVHVDIDAVADEGGREGTTTP